MQQTQLPIHEAAILTRLFGPGEPVITSATAKGFLALTFSSADQDRMHDLTAKSRVGSLSPEDLAEVEAYSRISSILGILKSKARRALKRLHSCQVSGQYYCHQTFCGANSTNRRAYAALLA